MKITIKGAVASHATRLSAEALAVLSTLAVTTGLIGCAAKPPACSDDDTLAVLKSITADGVRDSLTALGHPELLEQVKASAKLSVTAIRTEASDATMGEQTCAASLEVKLPPKVAAMLQSPLARASIPWGPLLQQVQVEGDHAAVSIRYTTRFTDDRKQIVVQAEGTEPLAGLVAVLGSTGGLSSDAASSRADAAGSAGDPASKTNAEAPRQIPTEQDGGAQR